MATQPTPAASGGLLAKLSERERRLVYGMLVLFACFGVIIGVYTFTQALSETEAEIERYNDALITLSTQGPLYLKAQNAKAQASADRSEKFTPEVMLGNNIKLTSFVAEHASAVDLKIDNYKESTLKLTSGKDGGPIIDEMQLALTIRSAEMNKVLALLDRIDKSKEPVILKSIKLRYIRKKDGMVRANINVSTYIQKPQES